MNPNYVFSLEFETIVKVDLPEYYLVFLKEGQNYLLKIQSYEDQVEETCQELNDLGLMMYNKGCTQAAINLYYFALSHPDQSLNDTLKLQIHSNVCEAYNNFDDKKYAEACLNHAEEALFLAEDCETKDQYIPALTY